MTKKQTLDQLMLLSALESWMMAHPARMPDYLHEKLTNCVEVLTKEVWDEGTK